MTQKCIRCHKTKDIKLFKEKHKTCKLCQWWDRHNLDIPDGWNKQDVEYIIEQIHDSHTTYLNDISSWIGRSLQDIIILLRDNLKLTNIRNQKIRVKVNCDNCNKEFETFPSKIQLNNFNFCCHKCYSSFRSKYYVGEKASVYTRKEYSCSYCNKKITVPANMQKSLNSEGIERHFCNHQCYSNFRKQYYRGDKLYNTGIDMGDAFKEKCRTNTVSLYENGIFSRQTKPQRTVNQLLEDMNIKYQNEKNCKYYSIDNYLTEHNLMIEVMGDYFHANPMKYSELNKIQQKDVVRDARKNTYVKKYYNINILYLWESDIKNNIEICRKLIESYIKAKGELPDYNSYNYQIENDKLVLNNKIINPYFIQNP